MDRIDFESLEKRGRVIRYAPVPGELEAVLRQAREQLDLAATGQPFPVQRLALLREVTRIVSAGSLALHGYQTPQTGTALYLSHCILGIDDDIWIELDLACSPGGGTPDDMRSLIRFEAAVTVLVSAFENRLLKIGVVVDHEP